MSLRALRMSLAASFLLVSTAATAEDDGVRRDPEGRTGISPYMEAIDKGNKAFVAGEVDKAIAKFQEAASLDDGKALAFYRMGEAQRKKGQLAAAAEAFQSAKGKSGDASLLGKIRFVIADLAEREAKWADAKAGWNDYADYLKANPDAAGYPETAAERIKQIDRRIKDEKDYGEVKKRAEDRAKERENS